MAEIGFICMKWFWFFVSFFIPVSASPSLWSEASAEPWTWQTLGTTSFSRPQHPCRMAWKLPFLAKKQPQNYSQHKRSQQLGDRRPPGPGLGRGDPSLAGGSCHPFLSPDGAGERGRGCGRRGGLCRRRCCLSPAFHRLPRRPHHHQRLAPVLGNGRLKPARSKTAPRSF